MVGKERALRILISSYVLMESQDSGRYFKGSSGQELVVRVANSTFTQAKQLHFFCLKYWASSYNIFLKVQQLKNKGQIYFCFQKDGPISPAKYNYTHEHYIQNKHKKSLKGGEKDFLGT